MHIFKVMACLTVSRRGTMHADASPACRATLRQAQNCFVKVRVTECASKLRNSTSAWLRVIGFVKIKLTFMIPVFFLRPLLVLIGFEQAITKSFLGFHGPKKDARYIMTPPAD